MAIELIQNAQATFTCSEALLPIRLTVPVNVKRECTGRFFNLFAFGRALRKLGLSKGNRRYVVCSLKAGKQVSVAFQATAYDLISVGLHYELLDGR